ncbi:MAG: alanine--glyoxylate aminotransferase family protein [Deltaproteobacteria bacterium]|nr:MAG: alanine--glyoxylate aminotransferase family protein [Deltaproteobacteria bacterium]
MIKQYLLAPGPTPIPPRVLLKMAEPIVHHRAPAFEKIMEEVREGLKYVFQTEREVLVFASSGTGAMEGAVSNFLKRGDKAICVRGGKFGERWAEICEQFGVIPVNIDVPYGKAVDPADVKKALDENPDVKAVYVQASETSTGVAHPVKEIADMVKERENTIIVVDAITALGVFDVPTDAWNLDIVVAGSQKAFMLPPGLAFAAVSEKAWKLAEESDLPKYYFDYRKEAKSIVKNQTAYTPAVSLLMGLCEVLRMMKEEGLENIFARHARLAKATREGVKALGLELFAPDSPSNAVTAVKVPEGIEGGKITKIIRDEYGVTIAGGQGSMKGKIFRIAHLGYADKFDVITAISALEMTLNRLGYPVEFGKGVGAAMKVLEEE